MKGLYCRLAFSLMYKDRQTSLPFLAGSILMFAMFYSMVSLENSPDLFGTLLIGYSQMQTILQLGIPVLVLFSGIFFLYLNSILLKNQKKSFGLFMQLGLEKRHILLVIFWQLVYALLISLVLGLGAGILLDKIIFLLLAKILEMNPLQGFSISLQAVWMSALILLSMYVIIWIQSMVVIGTGRPLQFLKAASTADRIPKNRWLITLLGIGILGAGYWTALQVREFTTAIEIFFIAVLLVIVGTYLLFFAGLQSLLAILAKRKAYYTSPAYFVSVSMLRFRLSRNAFSLASLAVLSCMVLTAAFSSITLISGLGAFADRVFPTDASIHITVPASRVTEAMDLLNTVAAENPDLIRDPLPAVSYTDWSDPKLGRVALLSQADFNTMMDTSLDIEPGTVLLAPLKDNPPLSSITIAGVEIPVSQTAFDLPAYPEAARVVDIQYIIITPDVKDLIQTTGLETRAKAVLYFSMDPALDVVSDEEWMQMQETYLARVQPYVEGTGNAVQVSFKEADAQYIRFIYSGVLAVGLYAVLLFTAVILLVMFVKQISEAMDDKKQFEILTKVGLEDRQVRKVIRMQTLLVFFLPLLVAAIHMVFASKMVFIILEIISISSWSLLACILAGVIGVFAVLYLAIYALTSRIYYSIIRSRTVQA